MSNTPTPMNSVTPAPSQPPGPPPNPPDLTTRETLQFVQRLAEVEIQRIDRLHGEYIRWIAGSSIVIAAIFGLFGFIGFSNLKEQAVATASKAEQEEVQKLIQKRLTDANVDAIVNRAVAGKAKNAIDERVNDRITSGIDAAVRSRIEPIVAEQVRIQRSAIQAAAQAQARLDARLSIQAQQGALITPSATVRPIPAPRSPVEIARINLKNAGEAFYSGYATNSGRVKVEIHSTSGITYPQLSSELFQLLDGQKGWEASYAQDLGPHDSGLKVYVGVGGTYANSPQEINMSKAAVALRGALATLGISATEDLPASYKVGFDVIRIDFR